MKRNGMKRKIIVQYLVQVLVSLKYGKLSRNGMKRKNSRINLLQKHAKLISKSVGNFFLTSELLYQLGPKIGML